MKSFSIKVFNPNGELVKEWKNASFSSFKKEINAGLGQCVIELQESFDYQGSELEVGNNVEIWVSDVDTIGLAEGGVLIYAGFITDYKLYSARGKEGISVSLMGHYTKLSFDILKNGQQSTLYTKADDGLTTTSGDISSAEVADVAKAVIDRYRAETGDTKIFYHGGTVQDTGNEVEYIFEIKTYRDALDKLTQMSPPNWFWFVDEIGQFYLKQADTTTRHYFIKGKHIGAVSVERNIEKLRNALLFWNGEVGVSEVFKLYQDDDSVARFGRRIEKYFDWAISDEPTAEMIANKIIAEAKDPEARVVCEILDNNHDPVNGYDIESIQVGDTCSFLGFDQAVADIFDENMIITSITYYGNKVEITAEKVKTSMVDWLSWINTMADENYSKDAPESYTV